MYILYMCTVLCIQIATSNVPGTTATVTLLHNNVDLYLGHVGDSRAMLCRNGKARRLTTDHCPTLLAEKVETNAVHPLFPLLIVFALRFLFY